MNPLPHKRIDSIPTLSWVKGEVAAGEENVYELLTYVTEAEWRILGDDAPDHPLLLAVFRPRRILSDPCPHSVTIASLRLETPRGRQEILVGEVPLGMFTPTSFSTHLDLPAKAAGDIYRVTIRNRGEKAEKIRFAVYGNLLPPLVSLA